MKLIDFPILPIFDLYDAIQKTRDFDNKLPVGIDRGRVLLFYKALNCG